MEKQYELSFGNSGVKEIWEQLSWANTGWVAVKNGGDDFWTYYPTWRITAIREVAPPERMYYREPGIDLQARQIR